MEIGPFEWLRQRDLTASYVYHYPPVWNYVGAAGIAVGLAAIAQAYCQNHNESAVSERHHVETIDALNHLDPRTPSGEEPAEGVDGERSKKPPTAKNTNTTRAHGRRPKSSSDASTTEQRALHKKDKGAKAKKPANKRRRSSPEIRKALPFDDAEPSAGRKRSA